MGLFSGEYGIKISEYSLVFSNQKHPTEVFWEIDVLSIGAGKSRCSIRNPKLAFLA